MFSFSRFPHVAALAVSLATATRADTRLTSKFPELLRDPATPFQLPTNAAAFAFTDIPLPKPRAPLLSAKQFEGEFEGAIKHVLKPVHAVTTNFWDTLGSHLEFPTNWSAARKYNATVMVAVSFEFLKKAEEEPTPEFVIPQALQAFGYRKLSPEAILRTERIPWKIRFVDGRGSPYFTAENTEIDNYAVLTFIGDWGKEVNELPAMSMLLNYFSLVTLDVVGRNESIASGVRPPDMLPGEQEFRRNLVYFNSAHVTVGGILYLEKKLSPPAGEIDFWYLGFTPEAVDNAFKVTIKGAMSRNARFSR